MVVHAAPEVDYPHLPGEEWNPLMESPLHSHWVQTLLGAIRNTLAHTDAKVTGNTPFVPAAGETHTAPDLMVIPGARDATFSRYQVGIDGPPPLVCVEVVSKSNTPRELERRLGRWVDCGVPEVYVLHPERNTFERVERVGERLRWTDARGLYSAGMNATVALVNDRLAVCFPGGRAIGVDDDSFAWLAEEQRRADQAESRADQAESRADQAESRADQAESRADDNAARFEAAIDRITAVEAGYAAMAAGYDDLGERVELAESRADEAASRAELAESRADDAVSRADLAESRADEAVSRADLAEAALAAALAKITELETGR